MPVYVRKHQVVDPPTWDNLGENDADYITDPELVKDRLPQPYRMIDNLLSQTLDEIWEVIAEREEKRLAELARYKPPKFQHCATIQQLGPQAHCLVDSVDGRLVFAGLADGVAAVSSTSQKVMAFWREDEMRVTTIHVALIGVHTYLITSIDDMGVGRLFAFYNDTFYLLKIMNDQEGGNKILATKLQSSRDGDFLAAALENAQSRECSLEVFKLPRDVWLKELESIAPNKATQEPPPSPKVGEQGAILEEEEKAESSAGSGRGSPAVVSERKDHKFTNPTMVLKAKPPPKVTGASMATPQAGVARADSGDVIGTGANHMISAQNLESRKRMFNIRHENMLKYLPKDSLGGSFVQPVVHFVEANRILPSGLEQKEMQDRCCSVAVWWTGGTQVFFYPLAKASKDPELKPDMVWPVGAKVVTSGVTQCSSLLALATEHNNVVVWDLHFGSLRRVTHVPTDSKIMSIHFLAGNEEPGTEEQYPPYCSRVDAKLVVVCEDGAMYSLSCGRGSLDTPSLVIAKCDREQDIPTLVQSFYGLNDTLLVCRAGGAVDVLSLLEGRSVCSVAFPDHFLLASPWEPVVTLSAQSHVVFVSAVCMPSTGSRNTSVPVTPGEGQGAPDQPEVNSNTKDEHAVFCVALRQYPPLQDAWLQQQKPSKMVSHTPLNDRLNSLFRLRLAQQTPRAVRMQQRWAELKVEADKVKDTRALNAERARQRSAIVESTIAKTPSLAPW